MSTSEDTSDDPPSGAPGGKYIRGILNAAGGAIPIAGGVLSAISGFWSEREQERVNKFIHQWIKMKQAEMAEQEQTVIEIMQRLDMHDEKIADRISSQEYQSLMRKAFRDWGAAESESKRTFIRNILTNAANPGITSDDVIRMFLQWIATYSELHFQVIASIYNDKGVTRARIWEKVGKEEVREDSAEADLFKLLIRDLSTGSVIRQHRETDYGGNFLRKPAQKRRKGPPVSNTVESAFEDTKGYELTGLGQQFVHFAMIDLPLKLSFHQADPTEKVAPERPEPTEAVIEPAQ
jgi:antitoxin component of RelBE/YafQ-DinJ toxin-antitoxin module